MQLNHNTHTHTHTECSVVSTAKRLRERVTMLRYTSFAYRVKEFAHQMSSTSGSSALTRNKLILYNTAQYVSGFRFELDCM